MPKQIKDYPTITTVANDDKLLIQSGSDNTYKNVTKANLLAGLSSGNNGGIQIIQSADVRPNNTDGGNASGVSTWVDRPLNTKTFDSTNSATIADNSFKLPIGTYYINAQCSFYLSGWTRVRLFNSSINIEEIRGFSEYFGSSTSADVQPKGMVSGAFRVTDENHIFKIQYYVRNGFFSQWLLGNAVNDGGNEIYAIVDLFKVA